MKRQSHTFLNIMLGAAEQINDYACVLEPKVFNLNSWDIEGGFFAILKLLEKIQMTNKDNSYSYM